MTEARLGTSGPNPLVIGGVTLLLLGAGALAGAGGGFGSPVASVVLGVLAIAALSVGLLAKTPRLLPTLLDLIVLGFFLVGRDPNAKLWSVPGSWLDLLHLTPVGATVMVLLYGTCAVVAAVRLHRRLAVRESLAILLLPFLFNLVLALGNDGLTRELGGLGLLGAVEPDWLARAIGRALVLVVFLEAHAAVLQMLVAGRLTGDLRLHVVLIGCAIHAALTPVIADLPQVVEAWAGPFLGFPVAVICAALAQSGLWAIVFVLVGLTIDALHGTPPIPSAARSHWRSGAIKGGIYGGVFIFLLLAAEAIYKIPGVVTIVTHVPVLAGAIGGAALFPLIQTIVGSADGTPPFFKRLRAAYARDRGYVRGVVVGVGVALALSTDLRNDDGLFRFLAMFLVGALAYAGVDLLADTVKVLRGRRKVLQNWHVYLLGALLGGFVGGALGWYFDAAQIQVVVSKFFAYVDVSYAAAGRAINPFGTYPLFNKYGAIDLGPVAGGVRLFFDESLTGVINWGIAAPLFSINFFVLLALLDRSLSPLKRLFSATGFQGLVEQAVRVLGWGLWMAPVINSFLRQSPDPAWYNQDGAIRTVVASGADFFLPNGDFRLWSLAVFTGLLAYDWLRVLIWFDHMGLRVATLVNLTFIGGDRLDEASARFAGHSGRTRVIPDGIRRFATWAPLLIPFYIPRGPEWDKAWTGAEQIRSNPAGLNVPVTSVLLAYLAAGLAFAGAALLIRHAWRGRVPPPGPLPANLPTKLSEGRENFSLANGFMRLELSADGRGYTSVEGAARGGAPIDISKRPDDPLQISGPFLLIQDGTGSQPWSLGYEPMRIASPDYGLSQTEPGCVRLRNAAGGLRASARVSLDPDGCYELWQVTLKNEASAAKAVRLTSFREIAANNAGTYLRDPDFNAIHVETWFVQALNAVFARNRLLRNGAGRMSHEVVFHAVNLASSGGKVVGYEDSRTRFLGQGGIRDPQGLKPDASRRPDDEGALYTFDPAASLTVALEIAAGGSVELTYVTGHATDEQQGAGLVARLVGVPPLSEAAFRQAWSRQRAFEPHGIPPASTWPFHFDTNGGLHLTERTPRPWAHVMANPVGFGTVVSNEGEIHSYMANERQNALTPFRFESTPTALPGQLIYVVDLATGEASTAGFVPFRREDARYDVDYDLGTATFRMQRGELELELTVFVLPVGHSDVRLLTIRNHGMSRKRYRVVPFVDMVLDQNPGDSLGQVSASRDEATEALLFTNPKNDYHRGWAFAATSLTAALTETTRTRFFGAAGRDFINPVMVETGYPDGSADDDGRRCASFCGEVDVEPGQSVEVAVVLGQTATREEALMASNLRDPVAARAALSATRAWWSERLSAIHVETNNPAFDRLVNRWLPYQALTARIWGRTGPNQRGGAFGYRDQLQDVLPFLFLDPRLARRQIVLHAGTQFREGDTVKWWHLAPDGKTGLAQRTRASDPHLWLPYVVARYVEATGDRSILHEELPYLEAPNLPHGAIDMLVTPSLSGEVDTILGHCQRAIGYTLAHMGAHGLPLVGSGDWNDGVDEAGREGRGESTWLACFFYDVLTRFGPVMGAGQESKAAEYRDAAARLKTAIDGVWTGEHYVFMFDDEGTPIDPPSIMTTSWPVLSGAADEERGLQALENGLGHLEKDNRILLLTPPFDENSRPYPGRIADYPPGVRENGGQYTHGATWTVDAYMRLAEQARQRGDADAARFFSARAFTCWSKISPLGKTEGDSLGVYGLAPHQQPADIYDGPVFGGRGGWSWYSGSAARMLSAAYAVLGLSMRSGRVEVAADLFTPKGELQVRKLTVKGQVYTPNPVEAREAEPVA